MTTAHSEPEEDVAQLKQRIYTETSDSGHTIQRTVFVCVSCDCEMPRHEVNEHMLSVHGWVVELPSNETEKEQQAPPEAKRSIVKRRYQTPCADGGVHEKVVFVCPDCQGELQSLESVTAHMRRGCREPEPDWTGIQVTRLVLPDGTTMMVCPKCEATFPDDAALLDHVAAEHGQAWASKDAGLWGESEQLDRLHSAAQEAWHPRRDDVMRRFQVVSLGSFCAVKFSIQCLGFGEAHMPFDWMRTRDSALKRFILDGFDSFFTVAAPVPVPGTHMVTHRSRDHSFWHDDVSRPDVRAKMRRRIDRFNVLNKDSRDLLFVRSAVNTEELEGVESLYAALVARFGLLLDGSERRVFLALVVDGQETFQGPILLAQQPRVMLFGQPLPEDHKGQSGQAYYKAVWAAIDAVLEGTVCAPLVNHASDLLTRDLGAFQHRDSGQFSGHGDLRCYVDDDQELLPLRTPRTS